TQRTLGRGAAFILCGGRIRPGEIKHRGAVRWTGCCWRWPYQRSGESPASGLTMGAGEALKIVNREEIGDVVWVRCGSTRHLRARLQRRAVRPGERTRSGDGDEGDSDIRPSGLRSDGKGHNRGQRDKVSNE